MRLAVFDVDGTLISGKSTEKRFIAWLVRRRCMGLRQLLAMAWFVLRWFPVYGRHVFRKNKAYLGGLRTELVADEARRFVEALPEADFIHPAVSELKRHRDNGDVVVLLSGTLQPIVDALCHRLGAQEGWGAVAVTAGDRYTMGPPGQHPFYHEKATLLTVLTEKYRIAADEVSAYADSGFDIPVLRGAGRPVAVNPDRELKAWARAGKHRIIDSGGD